MKFLFPKDSQGHDPKSWVHFVSADLTRWTFLGVLIRPNTSTSCPDVLGCYTSSATIVNGTPSIMYPGVHTSVDPASNTSHYDLYVLVDRPLAQVFMQGGRG